MARPAVRRQADQPLLVVGPGDGLLDLLDRLGALVHVPVGPGVGLDDGRG